MSEMRNLLETHSVAEIKSPPPVYFSTEDTFAKAYGAIVSNKILSAPLWHRAEKRWIGFLDIRDIVSMVMVIFDKCMAQSSVLRVDTLEQLLARVWENLQSENSAITLEFMARRNPFIYIDESATLFDLAKILTNLRATRVRRVAVLNQKLELVKVISQSSLLAFIASRLNIVSPTSDKEHLPEMGMTVKSSGVGTYPCYTVSDTAPAYMAFKLLDAKNVGGVAVVDGAGHVCGNISAKDLKNFILAPKLADLNVPVSDFLKRLRSESLLERVPVIHCYPESTLREVVFKLVGARVHRLYIVSDSQSFVPIGVVSLSDIMKALFVNAINQL